ncbi:MAG: NUDIX domain-containing protein [Clostridia bacterium]|nr:NUDIX domain-containing protein [Clostridia bacterium]
MRYEKSCGAVIYRHNEAEIEYLLVFNKKSGANGHWGFPKGHKEGSENEYETAQREIFEEIGIFVVFCGNAKVVTTYSPKEGVTKDAVYFLATPKNGQEIKIQRSEIAEYSWCSPEKARILLTYDAQVLDKIEKSM